jgi:hypothetical protein
MPIVTVTPSRPISVSVGGNQRLNTNISQNAAITMATVNQVNKETVQSSTIFVGLSEYSNVTPGNAGNVVIVNDNTSNTTGFINFTYDTSGTANNLYTSNGHLTYVPSSGLLGSGGLLISKIAEVTSNTVYLTSPNVLYTIDSFSSMDYRSAFYQIQIENAENFEVLTLNVLNTDDGVTITPYSVTYNNYPLGNFNAALINGTVYVYYNPNYQGTNLTFIRNIISRLEQPAPSGDLGYDADPATVFYDFGYDSIHATLFYDNGYV